MSVVVSVRQVNARTLAAVRRRVRIGEIGAAWKPALDLVWAFLRGQPGLRSNGHNVFLYHHPSRRDAPMDVDFGVEVARSFEPSGEVRPVETPAGDVAMAVHVGPYERLRKRTTQFTPGRRKIAAQSAGSPGKSTATGRTIRPGSKPRSCTF